MCPNCSRSGSLETISTFNGSQYKERISTGVSNNDSMYCMQGQRRGQHQTSISKFSKLTIHYKRCRTRKKCKWPQFHLHIFRDTIFNELMKRKLQVQVCSKNDLSIYFSTNSQVLKWHISAIPEFWITLICKAHETALTSTVLIVQDIRVFTQAMTAQACGAASLCREDQRMRTEQTKNC